MLMLLSRMELKGMSHLFLAQFSVASDLTLLPQSYQQGSVGHLEALGKDAGNSCRLIISPYSDPAGRRWHGDDYNIRILFYTTSH